MNNFKKTGNKKEFYENFVISKDSFSSLKLNDFDYTWCESFFYQKEKTLELWKQNELNYRYENNKHIFDKILVETIRDEAKHIKFNYEYNSHFFRSDEFKDNHEGLHILFGGCSYTEGVGAPISNMWSKILYDEIQKIYSTSGYFNISKSGNGWQKIINSFRVYVKKYGAPDYFFVLMPNLMRNYYWDDSLNHWYYWQSIGFDERMLPNTIKKEIEKDKENAKPYIATIKDVRDKIPLFLISWMTFIDFCDSIGTKIIWSTWDKHFEENIINSNLFSDTFFQSRELQSIEDVLEKRSTLDLDILDINARDLHPGLIQNEFWSEGFLKEFIKKYKGEK